MSVFLEGSTVINGIIRSHGGLSMNCPDSNDASV